MQAGLGLANYLDLSNVPPVLRDTVALERILQLAEVLNRITVPAVADVPDRETMVRLSSKRWRLPDTEIDIALIENGPRAGEFLVSAATVDRLQEFYEKVKDLPYRPGPAAQLDAAYRAIGPATAATIYDAFVNSPLGLSFIIPPRWLLSLPDWARFRIAGATTWQWLGLSLGFLIGGLAIYCGLRLARSRTDDSENALGQSWRALALPLAYMFVAGLLLPILSILLHIGGTPRVVIEYFETGVLYLATAWLAVVVSALIGEAIVSSERLSTKSLDSQLIRLGARLIGLVAAVVVLIRGGDELGFPAYSVLAGLGVGGIAVALAAQSHYRQPDRLPADNHRETVSRRPCRQDRRQRGDSRGCGLPQYPHQNIRQFATDDPQQYSRELHGGKPEPSGKASSALHFTGHL